MVCINLMDEAKRKGIHVNLPLLEKRLDVPVVGTTARKKKKSFQSHGYLRPHRGGSAVFPTFEVHYPQVLENAVAMVEPVIQTIGFRDLDSRWLSLRLLDADPPSSPK